MTTPASLQAIEHHVARVELTRDPSRVLAKVRPGALVVIEDESRPKMAIVDLVDFQILRAVTACQSGTMAVDSQSGLPDARLEGLSAQERFDVVLGHYLADAISLGRAAEALGLGWADLRQRLVRLGVRLRIGPETEEEILEELRVARAASTG